MTIDIRIYAAFCVEPQLFMDLRNENYRYYKSIASYDDGLTRYREAYKKLCEKFPFLSPIEPDPLDDVIEAWDEIDRDPENQLWET